MCKLTDKQQAFVYEYVQCLNATEAARSAGYQGTYDSLRVIGSQNLTKKHVRAAIDRLLKERALQAEEVLSRLSDQARGIPADCFEWWGNDKDGYYMGVNLERVRAYGLAHLIKKITYNRAGRAQVEFYDAQSALVHLGKYHSLFLDRVKVEDWRSEAIDLIRRNEITFDALAEEFDRDLATELFKAAGVPVQAAEGSPGAG